MSDSARQVCQGSSDPDCFPREMRARCIPRTRQYHQQWLDEITEAYAAGQRFHGTLTKRMSGIAANFKSPDHYELAMLEIETLEFAQFGSLLQSASYWTQQVKLHQDYCVESPEPPGQTETGKAEPEGSGPCPPLLKAINAVIELGPATLKANCDEVSLEGSLGSGWISGFGEVTYDARGNTITVVVGSKGSVGVPGVKGEFKSGVYVRVEPGGRAGRGLARRPGGEHRRRAGGVRAQGRDRHQLRRRFFEPRLAARHDSGASRSNRSCTMRAVAPHTKLPLTV